MVGLYLYDFMLCACILCILHKRENNQGCLVFLWIRTVKKRVPTEQ